MSNTITISSNSNSNQEMPSYAKFDKDELDTLISQFSTHPIWAEKSIKAIMVDYTPSIAFCEDYAGEIDYEDDRAASQWEPTFCDVTQNSVTIKFSHVQDDTEMFFVYQQK